ncbi:uncharacterized protein LOC116116502 [Pistacia vera]|uniref:uncharacterized protein LOC116116502 n=1 Tax=Pistacia vera TaxID=55513 RepID=UPI001263ABAE|nr:uncharacterized protein LOC116116502 [Pistacia vera]
MLKRLVIQECEKFTSKCLSFQEHSFHISEPKSIYLEHKINSNLEDLHLKDKLRQIRWQSRFKNLEIAYDKSANIPLGLLQRFGNLESLQLAWCRYEEMFSFGKNEKHMQITLGPFLASFQNLKVLNVIRCRELTKLMTPSTARSLVQLRELSVEGCEMVIEIVENEGDATTSTEIVFENLKKLLFRRLETLICFCSGNYSFNYPSLEELIIGKCPNMKTFSQGILSTPKLHKVNYESFDKTNNKWEKIKEVENEGNDLNKSVQGAYKKQDISLDSKYKAFKDVNSTEIWYNQHPNFFYQNLTHLFLWNCRNIKYAFPSSIAKSLHQLQQLKIRNCKVLEEIIAKEEEANAVINFVFPNVVLLKLQNLPKLTAISHGIHTSKWPMLKELVVIKCDKFTSKHMSFQENGEEGELHISEPKSLFLDDKINHDLDVFELKNDVKEIIWWSQSKALEISYDDSIDFPLGLLERFENLKELKLFFCFQYKELFFPSLPNLEVLDLLGCRDLMSLVPSSASLQNLEVMRVGHCNGFMMKLITPSMVRNLVQLREMSIKNCEILIEILENEGEGDATTSTEIVFDNLKKLSLENLESLTCFCSGNYSFNFPSLEELIIQNCPNMKTFSQGITSTPKLLKVNYVRWSETIMVGNRGNDLNTTIQQAHKKEPSGYWWPDKVERLTLSGRDIMSIWEGEFQESFGKVKTLRLINDAHANIPIQILHKFNSLEYLILKMSSYEEIFSFEEDEEYIGILTKLKNLELFRLLDLKCFWKQDYRLNSILQNLVYLRVESCHKLSTLLPSLTSFENLTTLIVWYCNGMQNLMSSLTAKSLVRLEKLSIQSCEMMIEVFRNEGDIEKGEIVFEKLKELILSNLESLTCFYCSGDYTLKFPNLEELYVSECSKMKTFSGGGLSMPRLKMLNYIDCSENDIDIIIQQIQNDGSEFVERFSRQEDDDDDD